MKKQESGRSMVEMLGVLAIIGVLSVGGIAGYMLSMNRFRANDLIDKASKFATLAYSTNQSRLARGEAAITSATYTWADAKVGALSTDESIALNATPFTDVAATGTNSAYVEVKVDVKFSSVGACEAAVSSLGLTGTTCEAGKAITLTFKQS